MWAFVSVAALAAIPILDFVTSSTVAYSLVMTRLPIVLTSVIFFAAKRLREWKHANDKDKIDAGSEKVAAFFNRQSTVLLVIAAILSLSVSFFTIGLIRVLLLLRFPYGDVQPARPRSH